MKRKMFQCYWIIILRKDLKFSSSGVGRKDNCVGQNDFDSEYDFEVVKIEIFYSNSDLFLDGIKFWFRLWNILNFDFFRTVSYHPTQLMASFATQFIISLSQILAPKT